MDYMKFDGFMGKMISKCINKAIKNKLGTDAELSIEEFNIKSTGKHTADDTIEVTLKVTMSKDDFEFLIEDVTG